MTAKPPPEFEEIKRAILALLRTGAVPKEIAVPPPLYEILLNYRNQLLANPDSRLAADDEIKICGATITRQ